MKIRKYFNSNFLRYKRILGEYEGLYMDGEKIYGDKLGSIFIGVNKRIIYVITIIFSIIRGFISEIKW